MPAMLASQKEENTQMLNVKKSFDGLKLDIEFFPSWPNALNLAIPNQTTFAQQQFQQLKPGRRSQTKSWQSD